MNTIPAAPPESGGILGCDAEGVVCAFCFDSGVQKNCETAYAPDVRKINRCIELWREKGIFFCGMIHSHPSGVEKLSVEDEFYIRSVFGAMPSSVNLLHFPVLIPEEKIIPFAAIRGESGVIIEPEQISILTKR